MFHTAGFQEDHKALSNKVFTEAEYQEQVEYVLGERLNLLAYARKHFEEGLLFFYFSSTDLQAHMFWWDSDEPHPVRDAETARRYHSVIETLYRRMDKVVGEVVERYSDQATILVMSDHGFSNFRRQFNLNTWLRDNGYLQPGVLLIIEGAERLSPGQAVQIVTIDQQHLDHLPEASGHQLIE